MKRKSIIMLLCIVTIICISGCNVSKKDESNIAENQMQDDKETEEKVVKEEREENKTESFFYDARSFLCERAWIQKEEDGPWSCIDPSGKEIFSLEENQTPSSNYQNGIAVIDNEIILDIDGNIVSSIDDGKYTKIKNDYYDDGYVFVEVYKNTIEETSTKTGILDSKGEWWLEPISISSIDNFGHGIYRFWVEGGEKYYDLYSNTYIEKADYFELLIQRSYSENDLIFIWKNSAGENHFKGDCDEFYNIKDLGFESDVTGFYNRKKELVIDMSEYADAMAESNFRDGYCAMRLANEQGEWFETIIDEQGNTMFEPISFWDNHWSYEGFSEGLLCYSMAGNRYDYTFIDIYGKTVLKEITPIDGCEFDEEGYLRVNGMDKMDVNKISYINTKGEIVF